MALFILIMLAYKPWASPNRLPIKHDVSGYYLYLPAILIHHEANAAFLTEHPEILHAGVFTYKQENGDGYINKYPIGLAFAYLPFFLLAHVFALLFGYAADGYSTPYIIAMTFHPIFYLGIGLYYLNKSLGLFFNKKVIVLTFLTFLFATNLFFYTTFMGNMPHVYLFTLLSIIIYYSIQWHSNPSLRNTAIIFLCVGLSTIIRPTAIQFILFPLLYNYKGLSNQFALLYSNRKNILLGSIAFILIVIALPIYWKVVTGSFIYYSYQKEGFSFLHPHLIEVLVGFKKGLLIYTPVLIFAFISFKKFKQKTPSLFVASVVFLIIYIYVVASWHCWWYGGSFGMRALVETYAVLAFPMAAFYDSVLSKKKIHQLGIGIIVVLFTALNLFQSAQYLKSIIYFEGMNFKAYCYTFGKIHLSEKESNTLKDLLKEHE